MVALKGSLVRATLIFLSVVLFGAALGQIIGAFKSLSRDDLDDNTPTSLAVYNRFQGLIIGSWCCLVLSSVPMLVAIKFQNDDEGTSHSAAREAAAQLLHFVDKDAPSNKTPGSLSLFGFGLSTTLLVVAIALALLPFGALFAAQLVDEEITSVCMPGYDCFITDDNGIAHHRANCTLTPTIRPPRYFDCRRLTPGSVPKIVAALGRIYGMVKALRAVLVILAAVLTVKAVGRRGDGSNANANANNNANNYKDMDADQLRTELHHKDQTIARLEQQLQQHLREAHAHGELSDSGGAEGERRVIASRGGGERERGREREGEGWEEEEGACCECSRTGWACGGLLVVAVLGATAVFVLAMKSEYVEHPGIAGIVAYAGLMVFLLVFACSIFCSEACVRSVAGCSQCECCGVDWYTGEDAG